MDIEITKAQVLSICAEHLKSIGLEVKSTSVIKNAITGAFDLLIVFIDRCPAFWMPKIIDFDESESGYPYFIEEKIRSQIEKFEKDFPSKLREHISKTKL